MVLPQRMTATQADRAAAFIQAHLLLHLLLRAGWEGLLLRLRAPGPFAPPLPLTLQPLLLPFLLLLRLRLLPGWLLLLG